MSEYDQKPSFNPDHARTHYDDELIRCVKEGGIAVIPTDTLYGVVARADDKEAVERIYDVKQRDADKPLIVLISGPTALDQFSVVMNEPRRHYLNEVWPGPVSVILPVGNEAPPHLHRGTYTIAFRCPANELLQHLLGITGPLVAPSANPQDQPPAFSADEARGYFGERIDMYVDAGRLEGEASRLVDLTDQEPRVLR